jgi:hypothetical protein
MKFEEALRQLTAGRKAKRLGSLLPVIEQKVAEGITHGEILNLLNANGFELTERTYKSYLYRYRKRRRTSGSAISPAKLIEQPKLLTADGAHPSVPTPPVASGQWPNKFEFNAGGLPPELLK